MTKILERTLLCALGLAVLSLPAQAQSRRLPTLIVDKMGQFFIGGEEVPYPAGRGGVPDELGTQWREFSTVYYVLPKRNRAKVPLILVPGAGLSCDMYMSTPDDREGWVPIFARLGHPTYCLSIAARAESRIWPEAVNACVRIAKSDPGTATPEDQEACDALSLPNRGGRNTLSLTSKQGPLNIWGICGQRTDPENEICPPVPDRKFPVENLDEFAKSFEVTGRDEDRTLEALELLLDRIGPSIVLAHSLAGRLLFPAIEQYPDLIKAAIPYEPLGCDAATAEQYIDNDIAFLSIYGNADVRVEGGGHPNRRVACEELAQAIAEGGGTGTAYRLGEDFGLFGHSHMYAQDRGNEKIARIISDWILENVERQSNARRRR